MCTTFSCFIWDGIYIAQAGLELLDSRGPPASPSLCWDRSTHPWTQLCFFLFLKPLQAHWITKLQHYNIKSTLCQARHTLFSFSLWLVCVCGMYMFAFVWTQWYRCLCVGTCVDTCVGTCVWGQWLSSASLPPRSLTYSQRQDFSLIPGLPSLLQGSHLHLSRTETACGPLYPLGIYVGFGIWGIWTLVLKDAWQALWALRSAPVKFFSSFGKC